MMDPLDIAQAAGQHAPVALLVIWFLRKYSKERKRDQYKWERRVEADIVRLDERTVALNCMIESDKRSRDNLGDKMVASLQQLNEASARVEAYAEAFKGFAKITEQRFESLENVAEQWMKIAEQLKIARAKRGL